jgi:hypothetical protein
LNIYDKKQINCYRCGVFVGEVDYDAVIVAPKCGRCANPFPENDDKVTYLKNRYDNAKECLVVISS